MNYLLCMITIYIIAIGSKSVWGMAVAIWLTFLITIVKIGHDLSQM